MLFDCGWRVELGGPTRRRWRNAIHSEAGFLSHNDLLLQKYSMCTTSSSCPSPHPLLLPSHPVETVGKLNEYTSIGKWTQRIATYTRLMIERMSIRSFVPPFPPSDIRILFLQGHPLEFCVLCQRFSTQTNDWLNRSICPSVLFLYPAAPSSPKRIAPV